VRFDVVCLFPEMCREVLRSGVIGRAVESQVARVVITDIRRFAGDRHGTVDDNPYGGGAGMILRAEPVVEAVESVRIGSAPVILMSPAGRPFRQEHAAALAAHEQLVFVCGRYKGFDERIRKLVVTDEYSLGDYVISGGELAALVMIDAIMRCLPGTLGSAESADTDSFAPGRRGLLDAAHYTRPPAYRGLEVPEVLLSGDHAAIEKWRQRSSLERTRSLRPDLLANSDPESTARSAPSAEEKPRKAQP
jgi:tRNA (guanine37-N1)-methyltransferase